MTHNPHSPVAQIQKKGMDTECSRGSTLLITKKTRSHEKIIKKLIYYKNTYSIKYIRSKAKVSKSTHTKKATKKASKTMKKGLKKLFGCFCMQKEKHHILPPPPPDKEIVYSKPMKI